MGSRYEIVASGGEVMTDLKDFALPPEMVAERRVTPKKIQKRRKHFARFPMGAWYEGLWGAPGATWHLAVYLIYHHWKSGGKPIKLANGQIGEDGISRWAKLRALRELECRGLVAVEWHSSRSPIVTCLLVQT